MPILLIKIIRVIDIEKLFFFADVIIVLQFDALCLEQVQNTFLVFSPLNRV